MPQVKPNIETFAKIKVIGIGGSGGSAVDRMVKSGIRGVDFIAMNTDVQALHHNSAPHKLHLGKTVTRGLGAGMDPEVGKRAAEEAQNDIREMIKDANMVFLACGLGGGTGSGASPVVAQIAKDMGILTVAVVTKPFSFEGKQRREIADIAYDDLARHVDTIISIQNDKVLQISDKKTSMMDAFRLVDDVLRQGVQGISEIITIPGVINVDFADVCRVMKDAGTALMGIGVARGEHRVMEAAKNAIASPLLDVSIDGARGILLTITGGMDLGIHEINEAATIVTGPADENVKVIFGAVIDESMGDEVRVTVIATGFDDKDMQKELARPVSFDTVSERVKQQHVQYGFGKRSLPASQPQAPEETSFISQRLHIADVADMVPPKHMIREDMVRKPFQARPIMPPQSRTPLPTQPIQPMGATEAQEDDLDIPTFLRKKMNSTADDTNEDV